MRRDWDREVTLFAAREGLTGEQTDAVQAFVDALLRLDSVEISIDHITLSDRTTQAFTMADADTAEIQLETDVPPEKRYLDLGGIGVGGMGEVRRVRDTVLNRFLAMKILRPELAGTRGAVVRFVAEAQATAQLQHPGVVPVHDIGRLPDGRWFFTMKELTGETFDAILTARRTGSTARSLRSLIEIVARMCDAVAYAHAHGAIHRDLKPANVRIGAFGEVVVLDWGLVKAFGSPENTGAIVTDLGALQTRYGSVVGTPAYMPPEQARGEHDSVGPPADVYALGAVLYEVLSDRRPYDGSADEMIDQILVGPPRPLPSTVPTELALICGAAMEREPTDRLTVAAFADAIRAWLEGAARRERALEIVRRADAMQPDVEAALEESDRLNLAACAVLDPLGAHASVAEKREGWSLQDQAEASRLRADRIGLERLQLLRSALNVLPGMNEVHERLAYVYHFCHKRADRLGDGREMAHYEALLRDHDRGFYADYLAGDGSVTVFTRPPNARIELLAFETADRRLVAEMVGDLPRSPFERLNLGHGSWVLRIHARHCEPVDYPVTVGRCEHWHGIPPGDSGPAPIYLPETGEIDEDSCYVPAGWARVGPPPTERVWVDSFVIQRFLVTNSDYLGFLNDLVSRGDSELAERHQLTTESGAPFLSRDRAGMFHRPSDEERSVWQAGAAVRFVAWPDALAYARWLSVQTGYAWRLPWELEWEKAARGVDGRRYVTGDYLDPTWADVRGSKRGEGYATVTDFPEDRSVYGVRGLSGGLVEWCADRFGARIRIEDHRVVKDFGAREDAVRRVCRGGFYNMPPEGATTYVRNAAVSTRRSAHVGFRLVRSIRAPEDPETSGVWVLSPPSD